jgi:DNA/RNA endonuclease G (NUC1)
LHWKLTVVTVHDTSHWHAQFDHDTFLRKSKKNVKNHNFRDFDRKLRKIEQEKFEKVKKIKVALEPHRCNGI